jgi:hypothetical protein
MRIGAARVPRVALPSTMHAASRAKQKAKKNDAKAGEGKQKEDDDYVPGGRRYEGLPHVDELTGLTPTMHDAEGRRYFLYTKKTFGKFVAERGEDQMPDESHGEFAFVVELPKSITREQPEFDFPAVQIGQTMHFITPVSEITGVVVIGTMFPERKYATGFLHLKDLESKPRAAAASPPAVVAGPAAAAK